MAGMVGIGSSWSRVIVAGESEPLLGSGVIRIEAQPFRELRSRIFSPPDGQQRAAQGVPQVRVVGLQLDGPFEVGQRLGRPVTPRERQSPLELQVRRFRMPTAGLFELRHRLVEPSLVRQRPGIVRLREPKCRIDRERAAEFRDRAQREIATRGANLRALVTPGSNQMRMSPDQDCRAGLVTCPASSHKKSPCSAGE